MMIVVFLAVAMLIVYGAVRIIMGWILPQPALAAFDRTVNLIGKLCFQISIIGLAGLIVYLFYLSRQP